MMAGERRIRMDRTRNRARAWALQALYAWEMRGAAPHELIGVLHDLGERLGVAPQNRFFADVLVRLVAENLPEIDRTLGDFLSNWRLDRVSVIDRSLLRLGVVELLYLDDVAPEDTLREMVYLSDLYGTAESPRFVHGVLEAVQEHARVQRALDRVSRRGQA